MAIYDGSKEFEDIFEIQKISCFEIQKTAPNSNQYLISISILLMKIMLDVGGIKHLNPHSMLSLCKTFSSIDRATLGSWVLKLITHDGMKINSPLLSLFPMVVNSMDFGVR